MSATRFSPTYAQARRRFLDAARQRSATVETHLHPLKGSEGEELAIDTARIGPAEAKALFIVSSGTHGPEGFAGSACQLALLQDELLGRATASGVAILLVHAVNPFGFSHLKRTNEDNVDLNRNFNDFSKPYPANETYEQVHKVLVPDAWPPTAADEDRLAEAMKAVAGKTQPGMASGQAVHRDGLFYAGTAPAWSNRAVRTILQRHGRAYRQLAWIDVHTGLGPYGHGEKIFGAHPAPTLLRARSWWGRDLIASTQVESVSPRTVGHITYTAFEECPQAVLTPMTLEYGTLPPPEVGRALRGEAWLAGHPEASAATAAAIRRAVRDAFYVDADDWKGMILGQFRALAIQTINGLANETAKGDAP